MNNNDTFSNKYVEPKDDKLPIADLDKLLSQSLNKNQENQNKMSVMEYFLFIGLSTIFVGYWFFDLVMCRLPILFTQYSMTWKDSMYFSHGIIAVCVLLGFWFTYNRYRSVLMGAMVIAFPFSILSVLILYRAYPALAIIGGAGILLAAVLLGITLKKHQKRPGKVNLYLSAIIIFSVLLTAFITSYFFPYTYLPKSKININTDGTSLIESNMEQLSNLNEDIFDTLALDERIKVMQCVIEIETEYLGLPEAPQLSVKQMSHNTNAYYKDSENHIYFNLDYLQKSNSSECLETVLHEVYHCWQKNIIGAYESTDDKYKSLRIFATARKYSESSDNYAKNGIDYFTQIFEEDARIYAEGVAEKYFSEIRVLEENRK